MKHLTIVVPDRQNKLGSIISAWYKNLNIHPKSKKI